MAFDLHAAQKAGGCRLETLDVAERRNLDSQLRGGVEHRCAGGHFYLATINRYAGHDTVVRSPWDRTSIADSGQTVRQASQRVHLESSTRCF